MKIVIELMTPRALTPPLGREFDSFLFASIGEERNGMALSLLSALARLDVDPWEETAALSRMPKEKARERLAALIATTTNALATKPSSEAIAARMIALLPGALTFEVPAPATVVKAAAAKPSRLVIALGVAALILAGYLVFAAYHSPATGLGPSVTTTETVPAH